MKTIILLLLCAYLYNADAPRRQERQYMEDNHCSKVVVGGAIAHYDELGVTLRAVHKNGKNKYVCDNNLTMWK